MPENASAQEPTGDPEQKPLTPREREEEVYQYARRQAADPNAPPPPPPKPAQGLWDRIVHGVPGKSRLKEIGRSIPRGLANLGNEGFRAGAEGLAWAADVANVGGTEQEQDARRERAKSAQLVSEEEMNAVYGARSDDPVAALAEGAVQAVGAAVLLRRVGITNLAAQGAIIDGVAFNPYEAGISEMLAQHGDKVPVAGKVLTALGKLGSVESDDSFATARLKRVLEGSAVGAVLEPVVSVAQWGAKKLRAQKVLASETATAAEKTTAQETVEQADKVIAEIHEGTYTPEGARAVARPNGDGTWRVEETPPLRDPIKEVGGRPSRAVQKFSDDIGTKLGLAPGEDIIADAAGNPTLRVVLSNKGGDVVEIKTIESLVDTPRAGHASKAMQSIIETADENGVTLTLQASPFGEKALSREALRDFYRKFGFEQVKAGEAKMVRRPNDVDSAFRETAPPPPGPAFTRAEAETQAATISHALKQTEPPKVDGMWTEGDVAAHLDAVERLKNAKTEQEAIDIVGGEDHFNLGAIAGGEDFNRQLRALISRYQEAFAGAKRRPSVPQSETLRLAQEYAQELGIDDWAARVAKAANDQEKLRLSVETVLKVAAVRQVGNRMADLGAALVARPHDPALMSEARRLLDTWHGLSLEAFEHRSELGRSLNILQALADERMDRVVFRQQSMAVTEARSAIDDARKVIDEATTPAPTPKAKTSKPKKQPDAPKADEGEAAAQRVDDGTPDSEQSITGDKPDNVAPSRDTDAVTAADFSLARAREAAERVQAALKKIGSDYPEFAHSKEDAVERAKGIKEAADKQRSDPLPAPTEGQRAAIREDRKMRTAQNPIEDLSKWLDGAEKELDSAMNSARKKWEATALKRRAKEGGAFNLGKDGADETPVDRVGEMRGREAADEARRRKTVDIRNEPPPPKKAAPPAQPPKVPAIRLSSEMSDEEIMTAVRLFQRSGGEPRNMHAVIAGMQAGMRMQAEREAGRTTAARIADHVTTFFINALISGAKTAQSIFYSGMAMNALEASSRVLAGVATANKGLITEGSAYWYAMFRYARENMKSASAAFREGTSLLEGTPPMYVKSGLTGTAVTVPGRVAGSIDEFTRVTAYRAEEYAKSLRAALDDGLSPRDAVRRAEADVRASIDEATGIGLNPEALERAGVPTLSNPLGDGTFMGKLSKAIAESPYGKLIIPFMRPSVNTFRFAWQNTPGLNMFNKQARDIILAGGEEAAVLHTRSVIAGSLMVYAYTKFQTGEITGNGPSDRNLRKQWLANHQPYSIRMGDHWISYRRMEPFATWLGLVADASEAASEVDSDGERQNVMGAVFTALLKNSYNKSWTQGLSQFLEAWDVKDAGAVGRFTRGLAAGFVPQALTQFNADPTLRETRSMVDAVRAKIPGLSNDLPAKYNFLGEPVMKQGTLWNRNFSVIPSRKITAGSLEDVLLENNIGLTPYPSKVARGQIDLLDPKWAKNGVLPYERLMEIIRESGLRQKMEEKVKSEGWQRHSAGTPTFPGGQREADLKVLKDAAEEKALAQMLREYEGTGLKQAYQGAAFVVPNAARYKGPDAEAAAREKYGLTAQP